MGAVAKEATEKALLELVPEAYRDDEDEAVRDGAWQITDLVGADWALKRLGQLEQEITDNEEIAAKRQAEIEARMHRLNTRAMKGVDFFRRMLTQFAEAHRDQVVSGKKKSRGLIHGTIGFRKRGGALKTIDRDALLSWARNQPVEMELVRTKEDPDLERIKTHAEETQMIPPGMARDPETEEVQIRTDMKEVK